MQAVLNIARILKDRLDGRLPVDDKAQSLQAKLVKALSHRSSKIIPINWNDPDISGRQYSMANEQQFFTPSQFLQVMYSFELP